MNMGNKIAFIAENSVCFTSAVKAPEENPGKKKR